MTQHTQTTPHNFTAAQCVALAELIFEACACKPHDRERVQQAVAEDPALIARVHILVGLIFPRQRHSTLLRSILFQRTNLLTNDEAEDRRVFDAILTGIFADSAPRDLFQLEGEVQNREIETRILLNTLRMRSECGAHFWQRISPLLPYGQHGVDEYEERLARSVQSALIANVSENCETLLFAAISDSAEEVRCAAMEEAPRFVDSYEGRQFLSTLNEHESDQVRRLALEALAPLIDSWEVAERIFWFTDDPDPQTRLRALTLLLGKHWAADHYDEILWHAYSPDPEVARAVRQHFSDEEIQRFEAGRKEPL